MMLESSNNECNVAMKVFGLSLKELAKNSQSQHGLDSCVPFCVRRICQHIYKYGKYYVIIVLVCVNIV